MRDLGESLPVLICAASPSSTVETVGAAESPPRPPDMRQTHKTSSTQSQWCLHCGNLVKESGLAASKIVFHVLVRE